MTPIDGLQEEPLVSVIVPCYNQGRFLADAIVSVQKQTYHNIEVIVVDDGSTDNTHEVASSFGSVKYVRQRRGGLSAARNAGVRKCRGLFVVFLDADDVLYPEAVRINLQFLQQNPGWAFVSGNHIKVDQWLYPLEESAAPQLISEHPYTALLRGNYIGMHGAVMYRSRIFSEFTFDTTLEACEDYDLYFRITRKYPVGCHQENIAAYRHHGESMSSDYRRMLTQVLKVHGRQRRLLKGTNEMKAWREGLKTWQKYYGTRLYTQLFTSIETDRRWPSFPVIAMLARAMPARCKDYVVKKARHNFFTFFKNSLPDSLLKRLHRAGLYKQYTPAPGRVEPGDFCRLTPFSPDFGFDRGGAIDRYYIEKFLEENQQRVRGRVLEIGDNAYTLKFGGERVLRSDVLHIDRQNPAATYIGDITHVPQIPTASFDCIIFTQTLHLIYDFTSALRTCYRILKPGGCLLLTVPGISHIDKGAWKEYWLWSFTDSSVKRLLADTFNGSSAEVKTYGNVYAAAAFLYGMGLPEFRPEFLAYQDSSYQVIISATASKF